MNCPQARPLLPALVYGDLPPDQAAALTRHLDECPACRGEYAGLAQVRRALNAAPPPAVAVDVAGLFAASAARLERRARRWRRLALAGAALAAGVLLAFGLRLQVRVGAGQLVIAWGQPAEETPNPKPQIPNRIEPTPQRAEVRPPEVPRSVEERLRLLQELTHALAADVEARDRRQQSEAAVLRARLDGLQQSVAQRWAEAERMVSALYVAQFKRPEEKVNP
jgi:Putative zinc-finger